MRALSRRTFLRGLAGSAAVTVALPTFEAMLNSHGTAFAQGMPFPKRFGVWFFGNGVQLEKWIQRGGTVPPSRAGWWNFMDAPSSLEQLNVVGLRESISVVTGTELDASTGSVHNEGRCAMMTGSFDRAIGQFGLPTLPSLDQVFASEVGHLTRFRSLEVGVSDTGPNVVHTRTRGATSSQGGGVFLPMEKDPLALFQRLFSSSNEPPLIRDAKLRSVVSAVRGDACRLKAQLGRNDQQRLDAHLDGLSDLERRITTASTCVPPTAPTSSFDRIDDGTIIREQLAPRNLAICKLLAYALQCDLTRTFCFEFTPYQAATIFPGTTTDSHTLTHSELDLITGVDNVARPGGTYVDQVVRFTLDQFKVLLQELQAVHDAPGVSVLDNSAIITATDLNQGRYHGLQDMPVLVAGKAGGALRSGNVYRYTAEQTGRAMFTAMKAAGSRATHFGVNAAGNDLFVDRPFAEMLT